VCSGGDPGCMYAVNSESIFDVYANEMQWKRDQSFEKKFEIGVSHQLHHATKSFFGLPILRFKWIFILNQGTKMLQS